MRIKLRITSSSIYSFNAQLCSVVVALRPEHTERVWHVLGAGDSSSTSERGHGLSCCSVIAYTYKHHTLYLKSRMHISRFCNEEKASYIFELGGLKDRHCGMVDDFSY